MNSKHWLIAVMILLFEGDYSYAVQKHSPPEVFVEQLTGMEFVLVRGGCFVMGDSAGNGQPDERPSHQVCVDDFFMGKYEVSQKQWKIIMGDNPSRFTGNDNLPVDRVSWNDIQKYLKKLRGVTGKKFRLPTEAEWEYSAKAAGTTSLFSGSDDIRELAEHAWYVDNSNRHSQSVGSKKANKFGLHDMTGNIWEWVSDYFDENYYQKGPRNNPQGPLTGVLKVMRGGSWYQDPFSLRLTFRFRDNPNGRDDEYGFRVVFVAE